MPDLGELGHGPTTEVRIIHAKALSEGLNGETQSKSEQPDDLHPTYKYHPHEHV